MKIGTQRNSKVTRLARLLGVSKSHAIGLLECLWGLASEVAPQGDIGTQDDDDIADHCYWPTTGKKGTSFLISALIQSGWVDTCECHRLVIHDWHEHSPSYITKKLHRNDLQYASQCPNIVHLNGSQCLVNDQSISPSSNQGKARQATSNQGTTQTKSEPSQFAIDLALKYRDLVGAAGDTTCTKSQRGPKNVDARLADMYYDDVGFADQSDRLTASVVNYAEECKILKKEAGFRKWCGNFFGEDKAYESYLPENYKKPTVKGQIASALDYGSL